MDVRPEFPPRLVSEAHLISKDHLLWALNNSNTVSGSRAKLFSSGSRNKKAVAWYQAAIDQDIETREAFQRLQERAEKGLSDFSHVFCLKQKRGSSGWLRTKVLQFQVCVYMCALCGLGPEWQGSELTLELDHINGNSGDDRVENLRFLCPNCHTQTPTSRSRNQKVKPGKPRKVFYTCRDCGKPLRDDHARCLKCHGVHRRGVSTGRISRHRKFDMTKDQAETMMLTMTQREMAKYFGVHPVTLRERLLRLGIKTPGSGCRKPPLT